MNLHAALQYLLSAMAHATYACQRTRDMVRAAIARYITLAALQ